MVDLSLLTEISPPEEPFEDPRLFSMERAISPEELTDVERIKPIKNFEALNTEQKEILNMSEISSELYPAMIGEKAYKGGCWIVRSEK